MKHPDPRIESLLAALPANSKLPIIDLKLDRVLQLLALLGNPQDRLPPVVHVAGTNGKGSLLAYLSAIFRAAGYTAHRYTSPHLVRFNERIVLAGEEISDDALADVLTRVSAKAERVPATFFEWTTAAAFLAFAETPADVVLLETGLGGRLDATNTVKAPALTAITPISLDHTEFLGETLAAIAGEKAGILKEGVACVTGPQPPEALEVIERIANNKNAPLYRAGREWQAQAVGEGFSYRSTLRESLFPLPSLTGEHQCMNAATAIACIDRLKAYTITDSHIRDGLLNARWPARLQHLREGELARLLPPGAELWLDGGHNPGAGEVLGAWAKTQRRRIHIICGMLKNKDTRQFLAPLAPHTASLTGVAIEGEPMGQSPEAICTAAAGLGMKTHVGGNIKNSIERIVNEEKNDFIILICGSLYLAGNILWQNSRSP